MSSRAPLPALAKLSICGLIATGLSFLGAAVEPGPGPRFVPDAPTAGIFYLPPLLMGLAVLGIAGLVATRIRWMPVLAGLFATVLLIASLTIASASVLYRLTHPEEIIGFAEDAVQVAGEVIAIVAGAAVAVQLIRRRNHRMRRTVEPPVVEHPVNST